ncbi:FKBP-type peptidyl-prolyl cis-trans isomerase [Paraburkholderia aspalathi]|nr:FKBP-type peptidyl-prolyl cis-trans isomerase [Paraburkholderia aspalathi]
MKQNSLLRLGAFLMTGLMASAAFADGAPGTETLPSGVVVQHVSPGLGAQPGPASMVEVEYLGQLKDGTVFDASSKHGGKPVSFPLNGVIPCWTQGIQRIRAGGTAILQCPAATAYGEHGAGGVIPPNADLTFKVHLVAVQQ